MSRQEIEQLIQDYPKHFSQIIKRDTSLHEIIQDYSGNSISEQVYNYLNSESDTCVYGNKKKFKNIKVGYGYCGITSKCRCAKNAISEKVSQQKNSYTEEEKQKINKKRETTNLKKHGVTNTCQTDSAKEKHKKVYQDKTRVAEINEKLKYTKKQKYGSSTYNNSDQISATWKAKSENYWRDRYPEKDIDALNNVDHMRGLYKTKSIPEICDELNVSETTVYKYLVQHGIRTPFVSAGEQEIETFLVEELGITNIQRNNRKILGGKELDFYLPDYNLAIEYNGVYWHHEDVQQIHPKYHQEKFKACEEKGIHLLTIFSSYWRHKRDIVKSMIAHKVGHTQSGVYARKCQVVEITSADARWLCEKYHLQGYAPCSIRYGLQHGDEIVAFMGFSRLRPSLGQKHKDGYYELVRYVTSERVIGGASKLLKHFKMNNIWDNITSYSNNEWSNGNMYSQLGFDLVRETKPGYWYVHPKKEKLMHRYKFAKHQLVKEGFDPSMTENEITKNELGLLKVWDCGQKVWMIGE